MNNKNFTIYVPKNKATILQMIALKIENIRILKT